MPPAKMHGFPYPAVEFEGLTITPYANAKGRVAYSFRAKGMRAPGATKAGKPTSDAAQKPAA